MRPVTSRFALLCASCVAFAVTAIDAQDGIIRSKVFPPVPSKGTEPVSLEEAMAVLKALKEVPVALTTNLHQAIDMVGRNTRAAKGLHRDVSLALQAVDQMRRDVLEPFRSTKGFPRSDLLSLDKDLGDVQELARSVKDDLDQHEEKFIRGDSNGDGTLDMSDALHTFSYLYLGGPASSCMAAADANDDEVVDISDGVGTLNSLFVSSTPLPPPGSEAGVDPTPGIGCEVGLETEGGAAGGGAAVRNLGPISIDVGLRVNCYWVCVFVCGPNWCFYYCYSICVIF